VPGHSRGLAYLRYSTSERKKWAADALAGNELVIAWPRRSKLALAQRTRTVQTQYAMF
jgi:hypothetical protein